MARGKKFPDEALVDVVPADTDPSGPDDPALTPEQRQSLTVHNLQLTIAKQDVALARSTLSQAEQRQSFRQQAFNQLLSSIMQDCGIREQDFNLYTLVGDNNGQVTGIQRRPIQ